MESCHRDSPRGHQEPVAAKRKRDEGRKKRTRIEIIAKADVDHPGGTVLAGTEKQSDREAWAWARKGVFSVSLQGRLSSPQHTHSHQRCGWALTESRTWRLTPLLFSKLPLSPFPRRFLMNALQPGKVYQEAETMSTLSALLRRGQHGKGRQS